MDYIKKYGIDENLLNRVEETIENNQDNIFSDFIKNGFDYDIFISTYNIHDKIDGLWIEKMNPKNYYRGDPDYSPATHMPQLKHFKRLIEMILDEERVSGKYDLLVFTRLDIKMLKKFNEMNINYEMFNSIFKNDGGGCDDNFFIFPRSYLDIFSSSIDSLLGRGEIVHRINREIENRGGKIHYMCTLDHETYMGHKNFEFVRCGSNPDDPFSINGNYKR